MGTFESVLLAAACMLAGCAGESAREPVDDRAADTAAAVSPGGGCRDPANREVSRHGVGALRLGEPVERVRRECNVIGDTTLTLEGVSQPALRVEIGGETVIAEIVGDSVWRITVRTPGLVTADSLGVGTRVRRFAALDSVSLSPGEGQYYVLAPALCGLSFGVSGLPGPYGRRWTATELADLPDSTRVSRILITGSCPGREPERPAGAGDRAVRDERPPSAGDGRPAPGAALLQPGGSP